MHESKKVEVFRIHGAALEPSFRDGEYLEVNFGREKDFLHDDGIGGWGAEIVVRYANGKHELVEYFGNPMVAADGESATDVVAFGHVRRRLVAVSPSQKTFRVEARLDTRWRERRRSTRTLYR